MVSRIVDETGLMKGGDHLDSGGNVGYNRVNHSNLSSILLGEYPAEKQDTPHYGYYQNNARPQMRTMRKQLTQSNIGIAADFLAVYLFGWSGFWK